MALPALSSLRRSFASSKALLKKRDQTVCIHLWHCKAVSKPTRMHSLNQLHRTKKKPKKRKSSRLCKTIESSHLSGRKTRLAVTNPSFRRSNNNGVSIRSYYFLYMTTSRRK